MRKTREEICRGDNKNSVYGYECYKEFPCQMSFKEIGEKNCGRHTRCDQKRFWYFIDRNLCKSAKTTLFVTSKQLKKICS